MGNPAMVLQARIMEIEQEAMDEANQETLYYDMITGLKTVEDLVLEEEALIHNWNDCPASRYRLNIVATCMKNLHK